MKNFNKAVAVGAAITERRFFKPNAVAHEGIVEKIKSLFKKGMSAGEAATKALEGFDPKGAPKPSGKSTPEKWPKSAVAQAASGDGVSASYEVSRKASRAWSDASAVTGKEQLGFQELSAFLKEATEAVGAMASLYKKLSPSFGDEDGEETYNKFFDMAPVTFKAGKFEFVFKKTELTATYSPEYSKDGSVEIRMPDAAKVKSAHAECLTRFTAFAIHRNKVPFNQDGGGSINDDFQAASEELTEAVTLVMDAANDLANAAVQIYTASAAPADTTQA